MTSSTGKLDAMALYAGQGVGAVQSCEPAGEVLRQLADGAEEILKTGQERIDKMIV